MKSMIRILWLTWQTLASVPSVARCHRATDDALDLGAENDGHNISLATSDSVPPSFQFLERNGFQKFFSQDKRLGSGGFGILETRDVPPWCKSAISQVAVKTVDSDGSPVTLERAQMEIKLLEMLSPYPFVSRIYGYGDESTSRGDLANSITMYSAMELVSGGTLKELAESHSVSEDLTLSLAWQAVFALHTIHLMKVYHHDIKLENLMLQQTSCAKNPWQCTLKIIDFGIACTTNADLEGKPYGMKKCELDDVTAGTQGYLPPEKTSIMAKGLEGLLSDEFKSFQESEAGPEKDDSFALGVTLLRLWRGPEAQVIRGLEELIQEEVNTTKDLKYLIKNGLLVKAVRLQKEKLVKKLEEILSRRERLENLGYEADDAGSKYEGFTDSETGRALPAWLKELITNLVHPVRETRWNMDMAKKHMDAKMAAVLHERPGLQPPMNCFVKSDPSMMGPKSTADVCTLDLNLEGNLPPTSRALGCLACCFKAAAPCSEKSWANC